MAERAGGEEYSLQRILTLGLRLVLVRPERSLQRPLVRTHRAHQTPDHLVFGFRVRKLLLADLDDPVIVALVVRRRRRDEEDVESDETVSLGKSKCQVMLNILRYIVDGVDVVRVDLRAV